MITHVVLFRWRSTVTGQQVREVADQLRALGAELPQLRDYRLGSDLGLRDGNDQFAVVATFDDTEALADYLSDPRHLRIVREVAGPLVAERHTVQFETP